MTIGLQLLSSLLELGSVEYLREIDPDWLEEGDELSVYNFIHNHNRRYHRLPSIDTVMSSLDIDLPETPEHITYYKDGLMERVLYNSIRPVFGSIRDNIVSGSIDTDAIRADVRELNRICNSTSSSSRNVMPVADAVSLVRANFMESRTWSGVPGIPTGWSFMDEQTGGWRNGDLITIVARMGVGKTYLLLYSILSAMQSGRLSLLISMEMPVVQIVSRMAAMLAGVDPMMIRNGRLPTDAMPRLEEAFRTLESMDNLIIHSGNMGGTVGDISDLIQDYVPDCTYLDGMYLLKPSFRGRVNGRWESIAYTIDEIKELTLSTNRPIVSTTQFSRQAGKGGKDGDMENIGYSDAIGTHSSIVIGVMQGHVESIPRYRNGVNDDSIVRTGDREVARYRIVQLMKGREGESGKWGINYSFTPPDFSEVSLVTAETGEQVVNDIDRFML